MRFAPLLLLIVSVSLSTTQFIEDGLGNNSLTLADILSSNVVQEWLNGDVVPPLDGINVVDILDQLVKIQNALQELASEDDECSRQLSTFFTSFTREDEWAFRMFDASAKLQPGLLEGNAMMIGHFDECLKIDTDVNGTHINGQYCTAYINNAIEDPEIKLNKTSVIMLKTSYGLCIPTACDSTASNRVARFLEETLRSPYHLHFVEELCMSAVEVKTFSTAAVVAIIFFTLMGAIVVTSTLYDILVFQKNTDKDTSIYIAFSFYTNGRKLFSTKKSTDSLDCLSGMKVISIAWIVLAHRFMYLEVLPLINLLEVLKWPTKSASGIVTAGNMAVDTFFLISGLLVLYVYLLHKEKGHTPSLPMFYIHRILRLTPAVAALVLFYTTLLENVASGPFWPIVEGVFGGDCKDNWWSTVLYVHNYVNPANMCISQTWYLAVDTQLYFLFPLLLYPLLKSPKYTLIFVSCLVVACCGISFCISWYKNLAPAFSGLTDDEMKYLYSVTHVRAPAWLIGILLGYLLCKIRFKRVKISMVTKMLLWSGALGVVIGIIVYHKRIAGGLDDLSRLEKALANSLIRPCWSLAISTIIFLCVTGNGGPINGFLSSPIFTVLVRISYSVYLTHILVIAFLLGQTKTAQNGSTIDNLYYFWGDYVFSSLLAVVWTLTFESPILVLEKIIFGKQKRKKNTIDEAPKIYRNNNNGDSLVAIEDIDKKLKNGTSLHV